MLIEDKKRTAHKALVGRVLEGDGRASRAQRRVAFDNSGLGEPLHTLISKVAKQPAQITDNDIARVKASGLSDEGAHSGGNAGSLRVVGWRPRVDGRLCLEDKRVCILRWGAHCDRGQSVRR